MEVDCGVPLYCKEGDCGVPLYLPHKDGNRWVGWILAIPQDRDIYNGVFLYNQKRKKYLNGSNEEKIFAPLSRTAFSSCNKMLVFCGSIW